MRFNLKGIFVLAITCSLCGFLLSLVYSSAKDKIKDNQKKAIYQAIEKIAKGYKEVVPIKVRSIDVYKRQHKYDRYSHKYSINYTGGNR